MLPPPEDPSEVDQTGAGEVLSFAPGPDAEATGGSRTPQRAPTPGPTVRCGPVGGAGPASAIRVHGRADTLVPMPEFIYTMAKARFAHNDKVILDDVTMGFYPAPRSASSAPMAPASRPC